YFEWIKILSYEVTDMDYKNDLFNIRDFWVSAEFAYFFYEFMKIIININNLRFCVEKGLHSYNLQIFTFFPSSMASKAIFLILKRTSPILNMKIVKKNNNKYTFRLGASLKSVKDGFRKKMYTIFKRSVFYNVNNLFIGVVRMVIKTSLNLSDFPQITDMSNIDNNFVSFTIQWKDKKNYIFPVFLILNTFMIIPLLYFFILKKGITETFLFIIISILMNILLYSINKIFDLKNEKKINKTNVLNIIKETDSKINDLKNISEKLVKEKLGLIKKIKKRTKELEIANKELQSLDNAKTNFFSNVSHEFRTPLTMIISPLEDIRIGYFGDKIDKNNKIFMTMENNANRLLRLINNILEFTKIESGKHEINKVPIDILEILRIYFSQIESYAERKAIKLNFYSNTDKLIILTDIDKLENIVFNLLSNALKFTNQGGSVSLKLLKYDDKIEIIVSDTGIGIKKENLLNIFERFYQVEDNSKRKYEGTGIGLAFTKELVDILGGTISCNSEENKGTEFIVTLPYEKIDLESIDKKLIDNPSVKKYQLADLDNISESKNVAFNIKCKNILLLEDNKYLKEYLIEKLNTLYNIKSVSNGYEGLTILNEFKPDIILSDIMMPKMDGVEFYKTIIKNDSYKSIPFIFISARADDKERLEILKTGAVDYITKPINFSELFEKINNHLMIKDNIKDQLKNKITENLDKIINFNDETETNKVDYLKFLTEKEKEIVKLITDGKQNKEIASTLNVTNRTVENYLSKIYEKLEVNNRIELFNKLK
ncbi:MAG TPA: ATP-binding protein, partial [Spirochaetota bacterium]|nr:ATP-binding protein [Spirochaetota bacterium]